MISFKSKTIKGLKIYDISFFNRLIIMKIGNVRGAITVTEQVTSMTTLLILIVTSLFKKPILWYVCLDGVCIFYYLTGFYSFFFLSQHF